MSWRSAVGSMAVAMAAVVMLFALPAAAQQKIGVANEGGIRGEWMLADGVTLAAPQYPQAFVSRRDSVCVSLGYLLNPDGSTSNFTLLKAWNSASGTSEPEDGYWATFAEAAADALKQWKFKPRPEVAQAKPVYTVATFVFGAQGATTTLRSHCAIPNLAVRLRELRGGRRVAGGEILERLDLDALVDRNDPVYGNAR